MRFSKRNRHQINKSRASHFKDMTTLQAELGHAAYGISHLTRFSSSHVANIGTSVESRKSRKIGGHARNCLHSMHCAHNKMCKVLGFICTTTAANANGVVAVVLRKPVLTVSCQ